jgi:hypothetical protein
MESYEIRCVVHDADNVIVRVGLGHKTYPIQQVIDWIRIGKCGLYVSKNNKRAVVYAKEHPTSGRWFLTTDPGGLEENDLDFLPEHKTIVI